MAATVGTFEISILQHCFRGESLILNENDVFKEGVLLYPSWSVRKRRALKVDWQFICDFRGLGPVLPPCSPNSLHRGSFQADRRELERLALSRRKDTVLLISSHQQMEAQSADPKKAPFVCWKLLGRLKSLQVLMLLSPSALLDSTGVVEVIYGEGIQL